MYEILWYAICCNVPTLNNIQHLDPDCLVTSFRVETPISWNAPASRSVHPLLQVSRLHPTDKETHRQTDHATSLAMGRILCFAWRCGLKIGEDRTCSSGDMLAGRQTDSVNKISWINEPEKRLQLQWTAVVGLIPNWTIYAINMLVHFVNLYRPRPTNLPWEIISNIMIIRNFYTRRIAVADSGAE